MRLIPVGLALATLQLFGFGCKETEIIGGKPPAKTYMRVASLSPDTTEIMAIHSDINQMVGRTASCNYPTTIGKIPIATKGTKPDYEALAKLQPGLILLDGTLYSEAEIAKLKELTKADVLVLNADASGKPLPANTVDAFIDFLYRFGATQADPMRISRYADSVFQARAESQSNVMSPKPKVAVLLGDGTGGGTYIAGTKSFQADVVRAAGGEPVGPDSTKFEVGNIESLIALDPDAILTTADPTKLASDGRLKGVRAIREGRIAKIVDDVLLRSGVRVDKLILSVHNFLVNSQRKGG